MKGNFMKKLITVEVVAEMLSLNKRSIWRYRNEGLMPQQIRVGGTVRWRLSDIEKWIALGCPNQKTFEANI